jgi:hypothetical protein
VGALSGEKANVLFTTAAAFANAVILGSESLGTHDRILLSQIRDSLQTWRARSPVFICPRNRMAQLYPQALGSIFVAGLRCRGQLSPRVIFTTGG